jgi:WD40 repeat protein
MLHKSFSSTRMAGVAAIFALSAATTAWALSPTIAWQTTEGLGGVFSGDGTSILIDTPTGFQMRRASNGALEKTITLPVGSRGYDARAFSPDKTYVGTTTRANGITRVDLWRVSDGNLARTINSDAVRNNKALDISSGGLIAAHERFAYGDGGRLRIFRVSDGGLVTTLGPYCRNSSPRAFFAPHVQLDHGIHCRGSGLPVCLCPEQRDLLDRR